ncbi:hypothetical protein EW146_g9652 [Bondarzewia mesenterica]|uniref:Uncharacterized protein n=1 Tax=Bondarzewia mesenterica TaxID=1095465 RepID=A0A4S4L9J2_9AGAM|nr:hypothetical protein EW146_g9652 [Bondarzewia mesenterica]
MSSAFVKSKLKATRDAISKKEFQAVHDASLEILDYEPDNYNAKVFLALSLGELGKIERSEETYRSAIQTSPKQPLAWQGLAKVYEQAQKWDQYTETLHNLAKLFSKLQDATKCAETIQKLVDFRHEHGPPDQLISALSLYLPDSPLYPTLTSLPPPDPSNPTSTTTYASQIAVQNSLPILEEIVSLIERSEEQNIKKKEVDNRRTRLNAAGPEEVKREVRREVYANSRLPSYYNEILNHPNTSDDLRRNTESKLLRHKQQYLFALPTSDAKSNVKEKLVTEVQELIDGIVLLKIPDELAWSMFIDGKDTDTIGMNL